MPRTLTMARDLIRRLVADAPTVTKTVREGRRALLREEGGHSLFAWPLLALARRRHGTERVKDFLYERLHRPMKNLDEKAGTALAKHLGAEKLFRQVDVLPTASRLDGKRALIEHETFSATAPIGKATKVVSPIAASLYVGSALDGDRMKPEVQESNVTDLLREAGDGLERAHRRIRAEKVAFRLVEKGTIPPFATYAAFQEKVASLETQDLNVVEAALNLDPPLADFGKVAAEAPRASGFEEATAAFYHRLASD